MIWIQTCCNAYSTLCRTYLAESPLTPSSSPTLALTRTLYALLITEIREALAAEEQKSKILISEIDDIQSKAWDERLKNPDSLEQILSETFFRVSTKNNELRGSETSDICV